MWSENANSAAERHSRTSEVFGAALSLAVAPLLVIVLAVRGELPQLGRYSSAHVPLALLLAESLKFAFAASQPELPHFKDTKVSKTKKPTKFRPRDFIKCIFFLPICVIAYFIAIILFGAPFLTQHEETLMLAILLTVLTVFPSCFHAGIDATVSILIGSKKYSGNKTIDTLQQHIFLTLFGTWCGGMVIPLDWDRPWQVWPVPCCLGALAGYSLSHMFSLIKLIPFIAKRITKKTKY